MNEIFWIDTSANSHPVRLALVLRPRGEDWLEDELRRIRSAGVDVLVSMLEPWEAESLGLAQEAELAGELGFEFLSHPIPDRNLPTDRAAFDRFVRGLADRLTSGKAVAVHCRGSIGRSTLASAATLIHLGWRPLAALTAIEATRGCPVPDTNEQWQWVLDYRSTP